MRIEGSGSGEYCFGASEVPPYQVDGERARFSRFRHEPSLAATAFGSRVLRFLFCKQNSDWLRLRSSRSTLAAPPHCCRFASNAHLQSCSTRLLACQAGVLILTVCADGFSAFRAELRVLGVPRNTPRRTMRAARGKGSRNHEARGAGSALVWPSAL